MMTKSLCNLILQWAVRVPKNKTQTFRKTKRHVSFIRKSFFQYFYDDSKNILTWSLRTSSVSKSPGRYRTSSSPSLFSSSSATATSAPPRGKLEIVFESPKKPVLLVLEEVRCNDGDVISIQFLIPWVKWREPTTHSSSKLLATGDCNPLIASFFLFAVLFVVAETKTQQNNNATNVECSNDANILISFQVDACGLVQEDQWKLWFGFWLPMHSWCERHTRANQKCGTWKVFEGLG